MQPQPTPVRLAPSPSGILVLDGYGVRIRVERGRLWITDGTGRARRQGQFHRATSRLRRVVLLGHTGSVTIEALRWMSDVGVGFTAIDADGRELVASAGMGRGDPRLRRAQAMAIDSELGDSIARRLIAEKIAAQAETLAAVDRSAPVGETTVVTMQETVARLHVSTSRDEIRQAEAIAAAAYWSAWSAVPVRFARRDTERIPGGWRTFGARTSPLTASPRLAVNPANALLNYLYAILEAEARLACLAVGLDPGLGVLHADQKARDSLALDIVEPVRPLVDRFVLRILTERGFRGADFVETRQGACRVLSPLSHELASTMLDWRALVGAVAERVATLLLSGRAGPSARQPTPLTGTNRSLGRLSTKDRPVRRTSPAGAARPACAHCGEPVPNGRRVCDTCLPTERAEGVTRLIIAGVAGLERSRATGGRPGLSAEANQSRGRRVAEHMRGNAAWSGDKADPAVFQTEILPVLIGLSARQVAKRVGISVTYAAGILNGRVVPHPRHWAALVGLANGGPPFDP
jgi:CRISPR-associated endonuclease Cas1